jgi:hypothetical protein
MEDSETPQKLKELSLDDVLSNSELTALFKAYCEKEHSVENFAFLEQLERFKNNKNEVTRLAIARSIFTQFIEPGSQFELNLSAEFIGPIKKALAHPYPGLEPDVSLDVFDEVEKTVVLIMQDTIMRFVKLDQVGIVKPVPSPRQKTSIFRRNTGSPVVDAFGVSPRVREVSVKGKDDFQKAIEDYKNAQLNVTKAKSSPLTMFNSMSESEQEMSPMELRRYRKSQEEKKQYEESPLTKKSIGFEINPPPLKK